MKSIAKAIIACGLMISSVAHAQLESESLPPAPGNDFLDTGEPGDAQPVGPSLPPVPDKNLSDIGGPASPLDQLKSLEAEIKQMQLFLTEKCFSRFTCSLSDNPQCLAAQDTFAQAVDSWINLQGKHYGDLLDPELRCAIISASSNKESIRTFHICKESAQYHTLAIYELLPPQAPGDERTVAEAAKEWFACTAECHVSRLRDRVIIDLAEKYHCPVVG